MDTYGASAICFVRFHRSMLGYVTAVTPNHVGANPFDLLSFQRSYSFRHALIGDAAYESLLRSKRRQYHGQIAAALQESFPEIVNANPELIAVHYTDASSNRR